MSLLATALEATDFSAEIERIGLSVGDAFYGWYCLQDAVPSFRPQAEAWATRFACILRNFLDLR